MKAVKRTMMAAAVGMVLAAPAWAEPKVDGLNAGVTASIIFNAKTPPVGLTVSAHEAQQEGSITENTPLADVTVTSTDATQILAVAWSKNVPKQAVNTDGIGAVITAEGSADTLEVKLAMNNSAAGGAVEIAGQKWIVASAAAKTFTGSIEAAETREVKAGTYTVSLDGAIYSA